MLNRVDDILGRLDVATTPQALDLPGYHLHPLKGNLQGMWSVTVRANWRLIFRFEGKDAFDVELIDYHQTGEQNSAHEEPPSSGPQHPGCLP